MSTIGKTNILSNNLTFPQIPPGPPKGPLASPAVKNLAMDILTKGKTREEQTQINIKYSQGMSLSEATNIINGHAISLKGDIQKNRVYAQTWANEVNKNVRSGDKNNAVANGGKVIRGAEDAADKTLKLLALFKTAPSPTIKAALEASIQETRVARNFAHASSTHIKNRFGYTFQGDAYRQYLNENLTSLNAEIKKLQSTNQLPKNIQPIPAIL